MTLLILVSAAVAVSTAFMAYSVHVGTRDTVEAFTQAADSRRHMLEQVIQETNDFEVAQQAVVARLEEIARKSERPVQDLVWGGAEARGVLEDHDWKVHWQGSWQGDWKVGTLRVSAKSGVLDEAVRVALRQGALYSGSSQKIMLEDDWKMLVVRGAVKDGGSRWVSDLHEPKPPRVLHRHKFA